MDINPASGTTDYYAVQKMTKEEVASASSEDRIEALKLEMFAAAENLEFEKAARIRDELKALERMTGTDGASARKRDPDGPRQSRGQRSRKCLRAAAAATSAGNIESATRPCQSETESHRRQIRGRRRRRCRRRIRG